MTLLYLEIIFVVATFFFLTVAIYFFVSRDTDAYRKKVDDQLKKMIKDRGGASRREIEILREELLSTIPTIHRMLIRFEVFNRLQNILRQADLKITVYRFIIGSLVAGFLVGLTTFFFSGSMIAMLIVTISVMSAPLMVVLQKRSKRFNSIIEQLPDALEMMVRSLQAGHSFSSALQMVATRCPIR